MLLLSYFYPICLWSLVVVFTLVWVIDDSTVYFYSLTLSIRSVNLSFTFRSVLYILSNEFWSKLCFNILFYLISNYYLSISKYFSFIFNNYSIFCNVFLLIISVFKLVITNLSNCLLWTDLLIKYWSLNLDLPVLPQLSILL